MLRRVGLVCWLGIVPLSAAACTADVSQTGPTVLPSPTNSIVADRPCALTSTAPQVSATHWDAASGSVWWLTYEIIGNACDREITLIGVAEVPSSVKGAQAKPAGARVITPPTASPPDLFVPVGSGSPPGQPLAGYTLPVGERRQIVVEIVVGASTIPQPAPDLVLSYRPEGRSRAEFALPGHVRFCSCSPP